MSDLSPFLIPRDTPINKLCCGEAFLGLTEKEKKYAHHLGRAGWAGSLICLLQTSPESPVIFLLLQRMFGGQSLSSLKETAIQCGLSDDEYQAILMYGATFYSNMGNYKSFGDTKFVPDLPSDRLHSLVTSCEAYKREPQAMEDLWTAVKDPLYSLDQQKRQLSFPPEGLTTYYSGNCTKDDAEFVKDFMTEKSIAPYNTRLMKCVREGKTIYEIRIASCVTTADPFSPDDNVAPLLGSHTYRDTTITVTRGDYSPLMTRINEELSKAVDYASNDNERQMLEQYILSFNCGSIDAHKNGSRFWIRNKGPVVETYMGFIETYRDPYGVRGEYEGFVAIVNKTMSAKFTKLVESAESFLPLLPWPQSFEKDRFLRPDFTSLDVLAYGSSGIPAGINIPNYDEIRQDEGFKNVSLGNVLAAASQDKRVTFLSPEDQDLYVKLRSASFEVQVGLHELLGHGSGKLLKQEEDGQFNFDTNSVINPLTGDKVTSWYKSGETWDSVFSTVASTYEECRAECVGIYLCTNKDILSIFGYEGSDADDIMYVNWLNMVRAGLLGLEFYTPESKQWRQAHMQGRYVILRVLLECGDDFVSIKKITDTNGQPDLVITLNRQKIESVGRPAIGEFLKKLQIYKSLADAKSGRELYDAFCTVSDEHLALRDIVMAKKLPRRLLVQPHTQLGENGDVSLIEFDNTAEGIVKSFLARFPTCDNDFESLWRKDSDYWN